MGNKVSTARRFDKLAKNSQISRSEVNQLPKDVLKQKYQQDVANVAAQESHHQPQQKSQELQTKPQEGSNQPSSSYTGGRSHQPTTFQSSVPGTPPGKDGFDPQMNQGPVDQNSDFMKLMNQFGRSISSEDSLMVLNSASINQLQNRKRIEQSIKDKQNQQDGSLIDSKILTTILLELNDTRYTTKQVLDDYQLKEEDLTWLNRFKVPNNYKQFKSDNKEGDINHEPRVSGKTLIDEELKRDDKREENQINTEPSVANTDQDIDRLKKRLSLDD